jgi:hypothetical protein
MFTWGFTDFFPCYVTLQLSIGVLANENYLKFMILYMMVNMVSYPAVWATLAPSLPLETVARAAGQSTCTPASVACVHQCKSIWSFSLQGLEHVSFFISWYKQIIAIVVTCILNPYYSHPNNQGILAWRRVRSWQMDIGQTQAYGHIY